MATETRSPTAGTLIGYGLRVLRTPPFATLTVIALLLWAAARTFATPDATAMLSTVLLAVISAYVQIAAILAAAAPDGAPSADAWLRMAFARRCFWRFTLAGLFSLVLVVLSAALLVIPSFFVGAAVALATPSAVLERLWPGEAVRRSLELTRGHRRTTGIVYAFLIWIPTIVGQLGYGLGWNDAVGPAWIFLEGLSVILGMAGIIALTRAYLQLSTSESGQYESGS